MCETPTQRFTAKIPELYLVVASKENKKRTQLNRIITTPNTFIHVPPISDGVHAKMYFHFVTKL